MEKQSVSATLLILFLAGLFAVIGSSFYFFVYKEKQIKVSKVSISTSDNIVVYKDENSEVVATSLELSDMEIGLKPATGELNQETEIPSTITAEGTSEGYYASVFVKTDYDYRIVIKNIEIETKKDELQVKEERKNIFISILDVLGTTKSLEEDEFELVRFNRVQDTQKLTFLIWIGSLADDILEGAKISFELSFESLN